MEAELTDPLGRLTPNYSLGTELVIPRGGGTGSNIKESDIADTLANRPNLFGSNPETDISNAVNVAKNNNKLFTDAQNVSKSDFLNKYSVEEGRNQNSAPHYTFKLNDVDPFEMDSWSEKMYPNFENKVKNIQSSIVKGENPGPVLVEGSPFNEKWRPMVLDGHHRTVAKMNLGIDEVPAHFTDKTLGQIWDQTNMKTNYNYGGRTMGNNAIGNAMRMALGGDAEIEMPHSLKELQDWKKNHPTPVSHPSMDDVFTNRVSGFEGAPPIAMPSNLDELLAYLRKHHAGGGRAGVNNANDDIDTSYLGNLLRGLKSIPETAYNYLANTSYNQMGSDALDLGKNVYHDVTEHPIENLLGALPVVGSGMAAYDAYKLNDRIKQAYASGNHEDAQKLERALALSSLGALPIFGELSSVGSSAARMAEEAALHGAAETGSRAVANSVPRDAYQVAENIASNKINQALDSAKKHMFSDVSDERITSPNIGGDRGEDVRANHKKGGRTLGNNAIDNALRLATGGDADNSQPDAPITLQDLKDWKKAHPLSLNKNAMDNVFSSRQSGFEGAEPIAMPANLDELMAYLRRQHHADGGRAHFDDGGEAGGDPRGNEAGMADRSQPEGPLSDPRGNEAGFAERSQPDAVLADVGSRAFGGDFNVGGGNYTGHEMPTGMANYSEQRMNTPYEGSLLSATMDPSTAFGMGYGSLVGRQNTRAGAAGFLGSAMGESGAELDPSAINAGSIGMLQETGPRRIGLENTLGIDTSLKGNALRDALTGTQMAQLGYGLNEVATKPEYGLTRNAMATGTNAANVADIALENFERPTLENQIKSAPSREAYAQGIMFGRPSGATLGVGQYDAAPASFRDALMGGVKQADQQRARIGGYDVGSMLAGSPVTDASNDPAITAARNAAIASGEMPQTNPYAGFSSEDPAEIARYNAAMNAAGPKNAYADTTLGQRVPDVTSRNPFVNVAQGASNFLTNMITPSYGINSPEYNKISQAVDIAREPREGRGGEQPYIPPTATAQAPAAPIAPYTTELGTYNQQLPSVGGMTAAQWAAANTAGDMSKVHGRIKYVNGAPMLEYYTQ